MLVPGDKEEILARMQEIEKQAGRETRSSIRAPAAHSSGRKAILQASL